MINTRDITGPLYKPNGEVWANASITIELVTQFATFSGGTILNDAIVFETDENGDFVQPLAVPPENAWTWRLLFPNNRGFVFRLGAGPSISIDNIIDEQNLSATVSEASLSQYLRLTGGVMAGSIDMSDNIIIQPVFINYGEVVNVLGVVGGEQDIDILAGNVVSAVIGVSTTTFTFSNPSESGINCSFTLYLTNGGSQLIIWPVSLAWADGAEPELTLSGIDILTFTTMDGGSTWYGFVSGLNMSVPI